MKAKRNMRAVFFLAIMILTSVAFFIGYYSIQHLYAVPDSITEFLEVYRAGNKTETTVPVAETENRTPAAVRLDLIFLADENSCAVIRVLDSRAHALHYFTIPADTYIELSEEEYRELSVRHPSVPQIFRLSVLQNYMDGAEAAQVLATSLETKLACRFSGYEAVKKEQTDGWFQFAEGIAVSGEKLRTYLEEEIGKRNPFALLRDWESTSGRTEPDIFLYAETLALLEKQKCGAALIGGRQSNGGYRMDYEYARRQLGGQ